MNSNWVETYWNAMLKSDFETAMPIKEQHFPKSFFKYKGLNEWTIKSLKNKEIHLAEMGSLNDPFECMLQFDNDECLRMYYASKKFQDGFAAKFSDLTKHEINLLCTNEKPYEAYRRICISRNIITISAVEQLETMQKRFTEINENESKKLRITCFTQRNDSLLMWPHYAQEHKGICLEYDFRDVDHVRPLIQPVRYSDEVYKVGVLEELDTMALVCSSLVKSSDWSYEQEWRITTFKQGDFFPKQVSVPDPVAVYLGSRFDQNNKEEKEELFDFLRDRNIPYHGMFRHPNQYKLISGQSQEI
ncbi:DUF2971 domain-containing protein [Pedobacter endophyticus]|uniref:DUF2971 domain-containing protein n=1 Tax=Pedobacter endophyticus TaxID=2789740 RepID=A0A7S9PZ31_9SPHI|nr:DUF2971 domain-containing protein [Pedobacter endophyticus]QPH40098.1 DUF2971 domain-containing protein [Pedobacter endophyticus]